ncbi:protein of unknown function [Methylocella tundrae]|uniref:Uncharacterized protein n=1 Tax=Methylocella tundrae TaxID=227605 RepID=A0A4U8YUX4_METTU|nr:protein of unknown function [Methylocella tundrae]
MRSPSRRPVSRAPYGCALIDHLNDSPRRRIDQNGVTIHDCIAVAWVDAIFRRHRIISDAAERQSRARLDALAVAEARAMLAQRIVAKTRRLIEAEQSGDAAGDAANRAADRAPPPRRRWGPPRYFPRLRHSRRRFVRRRRDPGPGRQEGWRAGRRSPRFQTFFPSSGLRFVSTSACLTPANWRGFRNRSRFLSGGRACFVGRWMLGAPYANAFVFPAPARKPLSRLRAMTIRLHRGDLPDDANLGGLRCNRHRNARARAAPRPALRRPALAGRRDSRRRADRSRTKPRP